MPLTSGTALGPYEIEAPLGAGGMGEVYRARDTRLDRTVAIKVLPEHVAADPDLKQRFEREAKTISSLNHPHICTLYDIGNQDGIDFLVMEFIEGDTLAQRLEKGALPLDQALKIAIEIADALDKAHRQGIVYRDLKPGNIMLTKSGAKLLDFGLAKLRKGGTVGRRVLCGDNPERTGDGSRDAARHPSLHGARATRRQGGRRPDRHLRFRRGHLRDGDREAAVQGQQSGESHRGDPERSAYCDLLDPTDHSIGS